MGPESSTIVDVRRRRGQWGRRRRLVSVHIVWSVRERGRGVVVREGRAGGGWCKRYDVLRVGIGSVRWSEEILVRHVDLSVSWNYG